MALANRAAIAAAAAAQGLDEYQQQLFHRSLFHHPGAPHHQAMLPLGMAGLVPSSATGHALPPQLGPNMVSVLNGNGAINGNGQHGLKREHDDDCKPEVYNKVHRGRKICQSSYFDN